MHSLESIMQVQMTQQIIKLINSLQSVTITGANLEANLKTNVQVVANSREENLNSTKDQNQKSKQDAASSNAKSNAKPTPNTQAEPKISDNKLTANSKQEVYRVVLRLTSGKTISVNLPKPLPVGANLELTSKENNKASLKFISMPKKTASQTQIQNQNQNQNLPNRANLGKPNLTQNQLQNLLTQDLSRVLPKHSPLIEVLKLLELNLPKLTQQTNLTPSEKFSIKQSIEQILNHFPKKNDAPPNAKEIKQAIQNNGVLFEANLAKLVNVTNSAKNVTGDLKFLLQRASILIQNTISTNTRIPVAPQNSNLTSSLQTQAGVQTTNQMQAGLQANLSNNPSNLASNLANQSSGNNPQAQTQAQTQAQASNEVLQQIGKLLDSAMAKIQTQQHAGLQQSGISDSRGVNQSLQVSIPFFANGTWQNIDLELNKLDTQSQASGNEYQADDAKIWQVTLNFQLKNWGKISTRLVLRGESLRADLWLETQEKQAKMQIASESLAARLRNLGAKVESITCYHGSLSSENPTSGSDKLIDTIV